MEMALPMTGFIGRLEKEVYESFAQKAESWAWCINALSRWEDENLLDNPTPELLAQHKEAVDHLLKLGELFVIAVKQPGFPDKEVVGMVESTQRVLRDLKTIWHERPRMSKEEADKILQQVFPEES